MDKQKNIPVLRFSEFDGDWERKEIQDFAPLQRGFDLPVDNIINGKYPVVFSNGILKYHNEFKVKGPGVVTGRSGTIGKVTYVEDNFWAHNTSLWVTDFKGNHPKFVYYFYYRYKLEKFATGSGVPTLNRNDIHNQSENFPTLPEQQKIASFFTAIDQKLTQLKKKKDLLEQYKKGVMQKIFSQEIRFKDDNGHEYTSWDKLHGNSIFETVSNKNHNSDLPILAITQEHGAIPRDLIDYSISVTEKSIESYKVVEKGDFIISLRSFQGGIEYSNYKGICSPAYIILRAFKKIDNRYFKYYFKTENYIKELNKKLEGIRDGKMISYKYFSDIVISVPCKEEQTKIANFISAIENKIKYIQNQIEKVEIWKKGLLQQMFV